MINSEKAGVYIHIPFCSGKCFYCDFYSSTAPASVFDEYAAALRRHILETPGHPRADTVYFGGGTPSIIGAEHLILILDAVRAAFDLDENAQITLEANPGDICFSPADGDAEKALRALRSSGFDRISFGVQSSCDDTLAMLGRRHSFAQARRAVETARDCGFSDISLDLMYALPGQSMEQWLASIRDIVALSPTHISCYALKLEEHSPLLALEDTLPNEDIQLEIYLKMVEELEKSGYIQYEISNFALPGHHSRHNVKYWTGADYYGFGPSAHSLVGGTRYAWRDDTAGYIAGRPEYKEYCVLTPTDLAEEALMLSLRTSHGIDIAGFCRENGQDTHEFTKILDKYLAPGLVLRENSRYRLTPRGMFVSDYIIAELFGALSERNA